VELSQPAITRSPEWGIASFFLYHPEGRIEEAPREAQAPGWPVVHLMITDPEDQAHSEVFTACCGINWRAVTGEGMITGNRNLATCTGRKPWEPVESQLLPDTGPR
jgi:hypothetical protein